MMLVTNSDWWGNCPRTGFFPLHVGKTSCFSICEEMRVFCERSTWTTCVLVAVMKRALYTAKHYWNVGDKYLVVNWRLIVKYRSFFLTVAIVGNNGVGKSTFLKLLIGQLEPVSDSITKWLQTKLIALLSELYIGFVFLCRQISQKQSEVQMRTAKTLGKDWTRLSLFTLPL